MKQIQNIKTKTRVVIIAVLLSGVFIPFACKKSFLVQTNTFSSTEDATFQKSSDVVSLVNSIYDTYQNSNLLKKSIWYYANFETHDWFNYGNDIIWNYYAIPADFYALPDFWNNAYIGIARANAAFGVIETAKEKGIVTPELAQRLTGEAYFLRGSFYYYLAGSFGGVPLELNAITNGLTPRSTQDSVFAQVVSDMDNAANLLPWKEDLPQSELGRATKGAALGYAGAARMWVKDYAGAIINFNALEGKYHLLSNFVDVHEFSKQNNDESLFEVQFELPAGGSQSWDGSWQVPGGELGWIDAFSWPWEVSGEGYDYGNPGLWYSYQAGDLRKLATICGPGDSSISPGIIARGGIRSYTPVKSGFTSGNPLYIGDDGKVINTCGTASHPWYGDENGAKRTGYYCAKHWRDPTLTGSNSDDNGVQKIFGSQNQILLRYSEILLDRAECKVRTGDVAGAMADLKLVRDRAFGGTAPAVMQDGLNYDGTASAPITDPLQMVLSEYRHELSGEYSLFYDLRRAGTQEAIDFIQKAYGTVTNSTNPVPNPYGPTHDGKLHGLFNNSLTAERELLPIPQGAISLNPNLTQNPGY